MASVAPTANLSAHINIHNACHPLPPQTELDRAKFFSKPRLALDCVGGASAARLVDCLAEGGQLVVSWCTGCVGGCCAAETVLQGTWLLAVENLWVGLRVAVSVHSEDRTLAPPAGTDALAAPCVPRPGPAGVRRHERQERAVLVAPVGLPGRAGAAGEEPAGLSCGHEFGWAQGNSL